ncbi:MAG: DUF2141 domain-containing protein [Caulobacteraceae bacterium]
MNSVRLATAQAASLLALCPALAQSAPCQGPQTSARLDIVIEGVKSSKGLMTGSLYPGDKSQFLIKNGALKVWSVPATAPVTHMCIWLKNGPGTYAFAVYHDANANGKWDHNLLKGIEGFGFSDNPQTLFTSPSYDQVKFEAKGAVNILRVRLRYP